MAELIKEKSCYCNKDLTEEEVKDLVKTINGKDTIWGSQNCNIDDKSYASLTFELNAMFRKYNINECIQKIAFLAMTSVETGFFQTAGEISGNTASSQYFYKGRGLLQLTGNGNQPVMYSDYQQKIGTTHDIIGNPDLVAQKLFLAVDSGGWVWNNIKALEWKSRKKDERDKSQADYEAKMKAYEWKRNKFPKGLSKSLNQIALVMKENEEDYFFLISRLLQGYIPTSTSDYPATLHLDRRKENLQKIKTWFKYDKNGCDSKEITSPILKKPTLNYVNIAISQIGTKEIPGTASNPEVEKYFTKIGYVDDNGRKIYSDNTAWCAAFANYCLKLGNPEIPRKNALNAVSFSYSGYEEVTTPFYGSFMVRADNGTFYRTGSKGHVAIVIGIKNDAYAQLGGNQSKPGENEGLYVNVVLRKKASNVKYFHPIGVVKIPLSEPLVEPSEKSAGKDTSRSDR